MRALKMIGSTAFLAALLFLTASQVPAEGEFQQAVEELALPAITGWAMNPDHKTLIVATGSKGKLVYVDTVADKISKEVEVDFQPTCLAIQGKNLIAGAKGSAQLHVLDLDSGKEMKSINLPGASVVSLACHPTQGFVFCGSQDGSIYAADLATGKGWKTKGSGTMLSVDPSDGKSLFAGLQRQVKDRAMVQRVGPQTQVRFAKTGTHAWLMKYEINGNELKEVSKNDHSVDNGKNLAVSRDGKRVAIAGGGGIVSTVDGKRTYDIPVYSTSDLNSAEGQIEIGAYPNNVAFHPTLDIGVAEKSGGSASLVQFKSKSLATTNTTDLGRSAQSFGGVLLTFGGGGSKIVFGGQSGDPSRAGSKAKLFFIPLQLTEEEQKKLKD